jgi:hypothetical protein
MKSFKQIALSAFITISAFGAVLYTSCNKDECKDVVCQNGGTCSGGTCTCATGYEGNNCETKSNAKFVKTWTASDKEASTTVTLPTYTSGIIAGTGVTEIKISKFSDAYFTNDVTATVSGNVASIASQQPDNDGYYVTTGTGTYDPTTKKISWTYTLKNPAGVEKSYTGSWQ